MAPTYGLAEQAAELISAQWYGGTGPGGYTAPAPSQANSSTTNATTAASSSTAKESATLPVAAMGASSALVVGLLISLFTSTFLIS